MTRRLLAAACVLAMHEPWRRQAIKHELASLAFVAIYRRNHPSR